MDNSDESIKNSDTQKLEREIKINKILTEFNSKKQILEEHYSKITNLLEQLNTELTFIEEQNQSLINLCSLTENKHTNKNQKIQLPYKKFYIRESNLTLLFKINNYQAIYNMLLCNLILNTCIYLLTICNKETTITLFNYNYLSSYMSGICKFLLYCSFKLGLSGIVVIAINTLPKTISIIFVISVLTFANLFIIFNENICSTKHFSNLILTLHYWDNISIILKVLAYFFEKTLYITFQCYDKQKPKLKQYLTINISDDGKNDKIVFSFEKFCVVKELRSFYRFYLLPTLIYRDRYPFSEYSASHLKFSHGLNCLLCLLFLFYGMEIWVLPLLKELLVPETFTFETLVYLFLSCTFYFVISLFVLFFGFAHSYSNFIAESLNFGDKKFYDDFYTASNPKTFIEKLSYIYINFCRFYISFILQKYIFKSKSKFLDNFVLIVFLCIIVDYIVYACIHTSSPIITICVFICLGVSFPLMKVKSDLVFLLNWMFLTTGIGVIALILSTEMYFNYIQLKFDLSKLNWIMRHIPKIILFYIHPELIVK
jgi:hypothetical protein